MFSRYSAATEKLSGEELTAVDLAEELDLVGPASLLYGLALEDIFKAIVVQKNRPTPAGMAGLFGGGNGHGPADLASRAGFDLSKAEVDLANRLSAFIEWAGRYPAPKKVTKMTIHQAAVLSGPWVPLPLQPYEKAMLDGLFSRADAIIFK